MVYRMVYRIQKDVLLQANSMLYCGKRVQCQVTCQSPGKCGTVKPPVKQLMAVCEYRVRGGGGCGTRTAALHP